MLPEVSEVGSQQVPSRFRGETIARDVRLIAGNYVKDEVLESGGAEAVQRKATVAILPELSVSEKRSYRTPTPTPQTSTHRYKPSFPPVGHVLY